MMNFRDPACPGPFSFLQFCPNEGSDMRILMSCAVLALLAGCSTKSSGTLSEQIKVRLLEGSSATVYLDDPEMGVNVEVTWARPGFNRVGTCIFMARKEGDVLTVECGNKGEQGKWTFEKGKLKSEQANAAPEAHWEWLQKRAREISEALFSLR